MSIKETETLLKKQYETYFRERRKYLFKNYLLNLHNQSLEEIKESYKNYKTKPEWYPWLCEFLLEFTTKE